MRKGLLVVGLGVAIVGATFIATLVSLPPPPAQISASTLDFPYIVQSSSMTTPVDPAPSSSATLYFSWVANSPIAVSLYDQAPCKPGNSSCPTHPALVSWPQNSSGNWTSTRGVDLPVYVVLTNNGSTPVTVSGTVVATYVPSTPYLPTWSLVALVTGAVVLLLIGGVAIFLGLFLRSGVYARPPPLPPGALEEDDRFLESLDESDERPPPGFGS